VPDFYQIWKIATSFHIKFHVNLGLYSP